MTLLILKLPPAMARRVAKAADILKMPTHEDLGLKALGLLLDSVLGGVRGRRPMSARAKVAAKAQRKKGPRK